ncbi:unnamed protein product [Merluccius merluccius]
MSRSLAEERDRIKRQIEELEETLGAAPGDLDLLSSDASSDDGSDDGSDDEIQLVEPSHQVSTGLVAQRDQIQQEIEELQTALVSQNAICLSDDDSSDSGESAGEVDIPETEEGCLQVNLVYQQVLLDLLNKLEQLLNQNTHAQKELLFQMAGPTRDTSRDPNRLPTSYQQPAKMYLGRFLKPYFKDKLTGLGPPANVETKDRTNKLTTSIDDKRLQMKRWEGWQKTLLINSVSKDFLKRQIQPKLSKVDYLSQKMYSARTEEDKETLKEQIEQLEKDIQLLRSQKEEELIGDRYDEHDWQKISNIDFEGTREAEDLRRFWQNFLHPSVNKSSWTPEEIKRLEELSEEHGERDWESIAEELGTDRTAFMCFQTYQRYVSKTLKRSSWSTKEDALLRELVEKMRIGNFIPYTQMSYFMEGHDPGQLMYRWAQVLDPSLRKGHWSKEEDKEAKRPSVKNLNASLHSETHVTKDEEEEEELVENPEEEEEENENEEEENEEEENEEQVVYMDSDDEKMKDIVKEEKKLEREEEEREQKKFLLLLGEEEEEEEEVEKKKAKAKPEGAPEEAPPGPGTTKCHTQKTQEANTLVYQVVERPHFGPVPRLESAVRSTLADASGRLLNTVVCLQPRALSRGKWHSPLAVLQVSESELYSFLLGRSTYMHSGRGGGGRSVRQRRTRGGKKRVLLSHMNNVPMDSRLMAVVTPWIGNLLVVPEPTWDRETGAYALRQRTQAVSLGSTPFFLLLLQVLNVDALGCKDVIETRQGKAQRLPPPPKLRSHKPRPNSVQALLNQKHKKAQELKEVQQILPQLRHVQPTQPLLPQAQTPRSPQSQWMLIPQPPSGFPPHLLQPVLRQQSTGAALPCITTVRSPGGALRPVQTPSLSPSTAARPAEPAAPSTPALAPPTSAAPGPTDIRGVKRDRAEEPSPGLSANQSSAGESQEAKRVRRMTVKAKVLEEVAQAKCTQVPARSAWLPARTLSVATPCESAARAPRHPLRREALQFDPALMFHEPGGEVQCWLSGGGGVAAPGLGVTLPYLPPFVSSLDTLCALLASKECLRKTAFRLLPPDDLDPTPNPGPDHQYSQGCSVPDPRCETTAEAKVAEVRKLVAKHCAVNPAYQMLKARFLSCFTVPALLATINPIKDKEVLKTASAATENTTLLQEGEGAPATHFTGINTQRPLETQDSSQDSSQDTSQDSSQESSQDQDSSDINSTNKQISDTSTAGQAS